MPSADLAALPHQLDASARTVLAVVETSQGERSKYAWRQELGAFVLRRLLPAGMSFPFNYGFVPTTQAEDGDPLDVMVLHDTPIPMGVVAQTRLIGVIEAEEMLGGRAVRNDRLVGIATASVQFANVSEISDLAPALVEAFKSFWTENERLRGVDFRVLGVTDAASAVASVRRLSVAG